jgi:hypothetical protein
MYNLYHYFVDSLTEKNVISLLKLRSPSANDEHLSRIWKKVYSSKLLLNSLPFVKDVAICNSLSFGLVDQDSDIDLFFILDSRRFFTSRLIISMLFEVFGKRRKRNLIAERFCLSFYVDENNLNFLKIAVSNKDYYLMFWFKSLIFLRGNKFLQSQIILENKLFLDISHFKNKQISSKNYFAKIVELIFGSVLFDWLELLLKNIQLKRALKKNINLNNPKGVIIKPGLLKFHVLDAREEFNSKVKS